jgi:hypothetical protein
MSSVTNEKDSNSSHQPEEIPGYRRSAELKYMKWNMSKNFNERLYEEKMEEF